MYISQMILDTSDNYREKLLKVYRRQHFENNSSFFRPTRSVQQKAVQLYALECKILLSNEILFKHNYIVTQYLIQNEFQIFPSILLYQQKIY